MPRIEAENIQAHVEAPERPDPRCRVRAVRASRAMRGTDLSDIAASGRPGAQLAVSLLPRQGSYPACLPASARWSRCLESELRALEQQAPDPRERIRALARPADGRSPRPVVMGRCRWSTTSSRTAPEFGPSEILQAARARRRPCCAAQSIAAVRRQRSRRGADQQHDQQHAALGRRASDAERVTTPMVELQATGSRGGPPRAVADRGGHEDEMKLFNLPHRLVMLIA